MLYIFYNTSVRPFLDASFSYDAIVHIYLHYTSARMEISGVTYFRSSTPELLEQFLSAKGWDLLNAW